MAAIAAAGGWAFSASPPARSHLGGPTCVVAGLCYPIWQRPDVVVAGRGAPEATVTRTELTLGGLQFMASEDTFRTDGTVWTRVTFQTGEGETVALTRRAFGPGPTWRTEATYELVSTFAVETWRLEVTDADTGRLAYLYYEGELVDGLATPAVALGPDETEDFTFEVGVSCRSVLPDRPDHPKAGLLDVDVSQAGREAVAMTAGDVLETVPTPGAWELWMRLAEAETIVTLSERLYHHVAFEAVTWKAPE